MDDNTYNNNLYQMLYKYMFSLGLKCHIYWFNHDMELPDTYLASILIMSDTNMEDM